MKGKVCITGGAGFVGRTLGLALLQQGHTPVLLLDFSPCPADLEPDLHFEQVDVRDEAALTEAFQGAVVVFHVASYGMSGSSQLQRALVRDINLGGSAAVVRAACTAKVEHLVATSTYNVVFGGQKIEGSDDLPYFPLEKHPDEYSRTKAEAEMLILAANMTPLHDADAPCSEHKFLRTCALRPAAIWGPGESRHMARVVRYLDQGLLCFTFGDAAAKMDFVHVENLVAAHILAAEALGPERRHVAAGQAYFISDGEEHAINSFDFFGQIVEGLGYPMPTLRLPLGLVYFIARCTELLHAAVGRVVPFEPLLTRAEVLKAGQCHWFVMDKARKELGYAPQRRPFEEVVERWKAEGHGRVVGGVESNLLWELLMSVLIVGMLIKASL